MLKFVLLSSLAGVQGEPPGLNWGSRPGQCPLVAPGTIGTCIAACKGDDSCPQGQKCCSNGCGRTCQHAVTVEGCVCGQPCTMTSGGSGVCQADYKTCAVNIQAPQCGGTVHAGQCPVLAPGAVGICLHGCSTDGNCAHDEKCCSNGCGRTCQQVTHPGCVCGQPCKMASGGSGVCQADRKTCAVNVQAPQCGGVEHPGSCPVVERDTLGICLDRCTGDESCPADEKCCSNGCGRICQKVTHPGCVCGQPCKMASGGSGVCQADRKTCAVNIQAPQCEDCKCGTPCKMAGGGSGVCQEDNKTCAVNIMAPNCGQPGKGKGKGAACHSNDDCRGNQMCVGGLCKPKGKSCRKACPKGQRCVNGACADEKN